MSPRARTTTPTPGAGYSGTPLVRKLGIKPGSTLAPLGAPPEFTRLLGALPDGTRIVARVTANTDIVSLFVTRERDLRARLATLRKQMRPDATVWVSWPKRASGLATDITEDTIRRVALPLGFVDVKVCAVDDIWSGLKLVVRKARR